MSYGGISDCETASVPQSVLETGGDLLSRAVSSQVPSALKGLTSVFGMGTGDPLRHCHRKSGEGGSLSDYLSSQSSFSLPRSARSENSLAHCASVSPASATGSGETSHLHNRTQSKNEQACPAKTMLVSVLYLASAQYSSKSSPRPISTGKLNTLLHLHRRPISW